MCRWGHDRYGAICLRSTAAPLPLTGPERETARRPPQQGDHPGRVDQCRLSGLPARAEQVERAAVGQRQHVVPPGTVGVLVSEVHCVPAQRLLAPDGDQALRDSGGQGSLASAPQENPEEAQCPDD